MKTLFTLLLSAMFLFLAHTDAVACSLSPTPIIVIQPDEVVFLEGDPILLEGYASIANCGFISGYRWQVDGSTVSTSGEYIANLSLPSGESSKTFNVQLRVQNSAGNYGYDMVSITIVRSHKSYYYLSDHLGSVRVTVNDAGDPVGWDDYYPFGLQMPGRTQNASNPNDDLKFTGYELEQQGDLNIYHAEARMYDPVIGRFMQVDPLTNLYPGASPYVYALNNPLYYVDPNGECPKPKHEDEEGEGEGKKSEFVCVAMFIQQDEVFINDAGDDREFSNNSDEEQSRVWIIVDVIKESYERRVNQSCTTGGTCVDPLTDKNEITVTFDEDGNFVIDILAFNSLYPRTGQPIDATFSFRKKESGEFEGTGKRNTFPSAEAYHWRNGKPTTLFEKNERGGRMGPLNLFPIFSKKEFTFPKP